MNQHLLNFSYRKAIQYVKPHYKDSVKDSLNDVRAQQQMIEGGVDTSKAFKIIEKKSLKD